MHVFISAQVSVGEADSSQSVVSHSLDIFVDNVNEPSIEIGDLVGFFAVELGAGSEDHFGCSLDVDSLLSTSKINYAGHSLSLGTEGDFLAGFIVKLASYVFVDESKVIEGFEDGDFSFGSLFVRSELGRGVESAVMDEVWLELLAHVVIETVLGIFVVEINIFVVPPGGKSHEILGEGTSLVGADVIGSSHGLAGLHFSDEVLVIEHLFDGVGETECDGEGETFRDGDDDDGDGEDEEVD